MEQLEDHANTKQQQKRVASAKRRIVEKDVDHDDLAKISNQIRNSRAELSH